MTRLRWGLIGASTIAAQHMIGAIRANGGEVAVAPGLGWSAWQRQISSAAAKSPAR